MSEEPIVGPVEFYPCQSCKRDRTMCDQCFWVKEARRADTPRIPIWDINEAGAKLEAAWARLLDVALGPIYGPRDPAIITKIIDSDMREAIRALRALSGWPSKDAFIEGLAVSFPPERLVVHSVLMDVFGHLNRQASNGAAPITLSMLSAALLAVGGEWTTATHYPDDGGEVQPR